MKKKISVLLQNTPDFPGFMFKVDKNSIFFRNVIKVNSAKSAISIDISNCLNV